MFLKKIWNKFLNKKRYKELQNLEEDKKQSLKFKEKFENEINLINEKIKNQKTLNLLHSGHAADIINILPVIKLSKDVDYLFININK